MALGVQIITTAEAETLPSNWSGRREVDDDDDIFQLCDNWELKDDGCKDVNIAKRTTDQGIDCLNQINNSK